MSLGGEPEVGVAQDFAYCDGSGILQVVRRLEESAHKDKPLARKLDKIRKALSRVQNCPPATTPATIPPGFGLDSHGA